MFRSRKVGCGGTKEGQGQSAGQRRESRRLQSRGQHIRRAFTQTRVKKEAAAIPRRKARLRKAKERNVRCTLFDSRSLLWESARKVACPCFIRRRMHFINTVNYSKPMACQWPHSFCNVVWDLCF